MRKQHARALQLPNLPYTEMDSLSDRDGLYVRSDSEALHCSENLLRSPSSLEVSELNIMIVFCFHFLIPEFLSSHGDLPAVTMDSFLEVGLRSCEHCIALRCIAYRHARNLI